MSKTPKRGRPFKDENGERRVPFNVSLPASVRDKIKAQAKEKGISASELIEALVTGGEL